VALTTPQEREEAARKAKTERVTIKEEHNASRRPPLADDGGEDDDEVSVVSSSKRRKLAITVNDDGKETVDLTWVARADLKDIDYGTTWKLKVMIYAEKET
jgi:hypothetical protein